MSRRGYRGGGGEGGVGVNAGASPGPPGGATATWRSYGNSAVCLRPSRTAGTDRGLPHGSGAHAKPRMKGGFERRGRGLPRQARGEGACCMLHVRLVATDVLRLAMRGPPFLGDVYCRWRMHGNGSVR